MIELVSIDVTIWSDIACPWCYIGKRRFEKALAGFEHRDQVNVTWKSYQLDPTLPEHDERDEATYLSETKGMARADVEQMLQHVTQTAKTEGLAYDFSAAVVANSRKAHRLLHAAKQADAKDSGHRTNELEESLLRAQFVEGKNIGDDDTLIKMAAAVGLDEGEAKAALHSGELDQLVQADIDEARQLGVQGVPFFVLANKYGVSGAQPAEFFGQALRQVWEEQSKSPLITLDGETGEACGPDGC